MKKLLKIISICVLISVILVILTYNENQTILSASNCINIFLVLLGFAITCYTFAYDVMTKIIAHLIKLNIDVEDVDAKANGIAKELKENIKFIFGCIIVMIICDLLKDYNIPLLTDTHIYSIPSLKKLVLYLIYYMSISFSTFAYIDVAQGLFNVVENSFNVLKQTNDLLKEDIPNE